MRYLNLQDVNWSFRNMLKQSESARVQTPSDSYPLEPLLVPLADELKVNFTLSCPPLPALLV